MAQQIIKQPNGKYCIYSTILSSVVVYDMDRQEVVQHFRDYAAEEAEAKALQKLDAVDSGEKAYNQFTETWDQVKHTIPQADRRKC